MEEVLIMGDIGVRTTETILDDLRDAVKKEHIKEPSECKEFLINEIKEQMEKLAGKVVLDCHNIINLPGVYHI